MGKPEILKYYKIEGGKLIRLKRVCPRCKRFMAEHSDRWTCGYCGYTIFKKQEGP